MQSRSERVTVLVHHIARWLRDEEAARQGYAALAEVEELTVELLGRLSATESEAIDSSKKRQKQCSTKVQQPDQTELRLTLDVLDVRLVQLAMGVIIVLATQHQDKQPSLEAVQA